MVGELQAVVEELGGEPILGRPLRTGADLQAAIPAGFPQPVVQEVMHGAGITLKELASSLDLSARSLQRRRREGRLAAYESDRVNRILRGPFSKKPLDGEGAYRFGGRWSSAGVRLAYTAGHLPLAMIDYFVRIDADDASRDLVVVTADIPQGLSRIAISEKRLPRSHFDTALRYRSGRIELAV
jgi:hypothetical protein